MLSNNITVDKRLNDYLLKCNNSQFIEISRRFHVFNNAIDFMKLINRQQNLFHDFHLEKNVKIEFTYHAEQDEATAALSTFSEE